MTGADALVYELLHALAAIGLGRVDVAFRIGGDAVDAVEFARLPATFAERRQHFERVAIEDVHAVVFAVGKVDVFLLRILRERDVPDGSGAERGLFDELLFDESAIRFEDLYAVVHAIADVQQVVVRELRAVHRIAELLRRRRIRIVPAVIDVVRLVPVSAPVAFVLAGLRVEHDHAMVAVAVGDIQFIGLGIDKSLGGQPQILEVVAAFALARLADLHQEFSVLRELQDHIVVIGLESASAAASASCCRLFIGAVYRAPATRRATAIIAADPDVALVIDGDPVIRIRPVVAVARTAPVADQVARLIELENRRRRSAALRGGRIGGGMQLARFQRAGPMNDPDMVLRIDGDADGLSQNPVVRQRLRPVAGRLRIAAPALRQPELSCRERRTRYRGA